MRLVRELAAARVLANQAMIDLHAAAFVTRGRAVLLVGAKQAGKTTLLVHALSSGEASLLANDRTFVDVRRGQALGMPTVVVVREGTVQTFPALARGLPPQAAYLHTGEMTASAASPTQRLVLTPAQLAGQMGASIVPQAPIGAIVFPQISASVRGWSLEPMAAADAAVALRENLYGARSGPRTSTVIQDMLSSPSGSKDLPMDSLVANVPMLSCRLGPDAYAENASAWLRALPLDLEKTG